MERQEKLLKRVRPDFEESGKEDGEKLGKVRRSSPLPIICRFYDSELTTLGELKAHSEFHWHEQQQPPRHYHDDYCYNYEFCEFSTSPDLLESHKMIDRLVKLCDDLHILEENWEEFCTGEKMNNLDGKYPENSDMNCSSTLRSNYQDFKYEDKKENNNNNNKDISRNYNSI